MNKNEKSSFFYRSFQTAILVKGVDGVLELIGAVLLLFSTPEGINKVVILLTQHELAEDPEDVIANILLKASRDFSVRSLYFGFLYLLLHGAAKIFLVAMLWQRKHWAYPLTEIFLIFFIVYQAYRYTYSHSLWLIVLTIFDFTVIFLTWIEYLREKRSGHGKTSKA